MRKGLLALSCLLYSALPASAQIVIKSEDWCRNDTGSQCAFASAETLCRHHGLKAGFGLRSSNRGACLSASHLATTLNRLGIKTIYQNAGNKDRAILRNAHKRKLGAIIGVNGTHCICLTAFNEDSGTAQTVGNMTGGPNVQDWKIDDLMRVWDGFTVVVLDERPCGCCKACDCPESFCDCQKGSTSKLCAKACACLSPASAPTVVKDGSNGYEWKALTNGDVQHLSLEKNGKPVGTYRLSDGKYWDYSSGQLVESKLPTALPPREPPKAEPLRMLMPGVLYAPQGGCPSGSCSSSSGGGRRR